MNAGNKYYDLIFGNCMQIFSEDWRSLITLKIYLTLLLSHKVEKKTHFKILNRLQGIRMTYCNKIYYYS